VLLAIGIAGGRLVAADTALRGETDIRLAPVLAETFEQNARGWPNLGDSADQASAINGGVLRWENRSPQRVQTTVLELSVSATRAHEYAVDVRLDGAKSTAGFVLTGASGLVIYDFVLLDAQGGWRIGHWNGVGLLDTAAGKAGAAFRADDWNRIAVRIHGEQRVVFINGVPVWSGDRGKKNGTWSGLLVTPGSAARFDHFTIHYLRAEAPVLQRQFAAYAAAVGDATKVFLAGPASRPPEPVPAVAPVASTPPAPASAPAPAPASASAPAASTTSTTPSASVRPSPDTLQEWFVSGFQLQQARRYEEAAVVFRRLLAADPTHVNGRVQLAWCLLNQGKFADARAETTAAFAEDPLHLPVSALQAYALAATGQWDIARDRLWDAFLLDWDRSAAPFLLKDADDLVANGHGPAFATRLKTMMLEAQRETNGATAALLGSNPPAALRALPRLQARVGLQVANNYLAGGNAAAARDVATVALGKVQVQGVDRIAARLQADLLDALCRALGNLRERLALRERAQQLIATRGTGRDERYWAQGRNHLGMSYLGTTIGPERALARAEFERALAMAQAQGLTDLESDVGSNLALSHWQAGEHERARTTYRELAARAEARKNWRGAEGMLNNLAVLDFHAGNYAQAAGTFRRAIALTEQARAALTGEQRIHFLASRLSAYQFLNDCLVRSGDFAGAFEAGNALRARVLAETLQLGATPAPMKLAEFQATLAEEEAAVFYTVYGGGEVGIQVVTRSGSVARTHADFPTFVGLKKQYLDRLNAKRPGYRPAGAVLGADGGLYRDRDLANQISLGDFEELVELLRTAIESEGKLPPAVRREIVQRFLGALHGLLIAPVEAQLAGKKKLILFPDGILYFLPFEALRDAAGKHLVERFDVRYCQSAEVWRQLRARPAASGRKPFLGFGGAQYAGLQEKAEPPQNAARMLQLQLQAQDNAAAGRPQRDVYAALFGNTPMSYLPGSLREVQNLSRIVTGSGVAPVTFTGTEMTENRIKQMARTGELKDFRIVHFATHGFAIPEVPELSGLAMSIFPTPQGGEDGFLSAPEIAKLGLQADLVVLSACQTGLGRIYGGEGVQGLTGALLEGGANRALVSLWPVSDAGTMQFMTDVYQLHFAGKVPWDDAVNAVKRRFVAGKYGPEFQDLFIWAPFIHYGR
jgi:CHAT domain-containing protein/Tfp pilus assembly protein PilF